MDQLVTIVDAAPEDGAGLADLLARAFQDDPVSRWVFPDDEQRAERHPRFFQPFVDLAMATGHVYTTSDRVGVTLWFEVRPDQNGNDNGFDELQRDACGPFYERFAFLGEQMEAKHPHNRAFWHLQFIAVEPERQEKGIGTALLRHQLADFDARQIPTYLEASSSRNTSLYERFGFQRLHPPIDLPDGPTMRPMWREPGVSTPLTEPR